jgi:hypothetical protein
MRMSRKPEGSCVTSSRGSGANVRPVASAFRRKIVPWLLLCATCCAGVETKTGVYATLAEARAAGAVARGWVPEGLPGSATDLREAHYGNDQHWGLFVFPPADGEAVRALVGPEITDTAPRCDPPGRLEWWPRILRSPLDLSQLHSTGLRLYRGRNNRLIYAVNWQQGKAFYWK